MELGEPTALFLYVLARVIGPDETVRNADLPVESIRLQRVDDGQSKIYVEVAGRSGSAATESNSKKRGERAVLNVASRHLLPLGARRLALAFHTDNSSPSHRTLRDISPSRPVSRSTDYTRNTSVLDRAGSGFGGQQPVKIDLDGLEESWFRHREGFRLTRSAGARLGKRLGDIFFAVLGLSLLFPFFAFLAVWIRLESPGPVFYLQTRSGLGMRPFRMIKFRSMRNDAERDGVRWAEENDPRITRAGRFLRLTRLDEMPQLINILRGEMSLFGPRPERPEFDTILAEEIPFYAQRYSVLPGLSGWAQVMFTYGASVDDAREKLSYDLYYIKNFSPLLDLRIAAKTFWVVVTGKGR